MSCRSTASELASIDALILSYHRDLIGCRNKYRKDTINREIARLQSRRAAIVASAVPAEKKKAV